MGHSYLPKMGGFVTANPAWMRTHPMSHANSCAGVHGITRCLAIGAKINGWVSGAANHSKAARSIHATRKWTNQHRHDIGNRFGKRIVRQHSRIYCIDCQIWRLFQVQRCPTNSCFRNYSTKIRMFKEAAATYWTDCMHGFEQLRCTFQINSLTMKWIQKLKYR